LLLRRARCDWVTSFNYANINQGVRDDMSLVSIPSTTQVSPSKS
jgi:hypothetical protein